jgi:hypothetical protein
MAKSYDPTMPDDTDKVRFLTGDRFDGKMILEDEEIEWLLTQEANIYRAAAAACDQLAVAIAGSITTASGAGPISRKKVGNLELQYATGSGRTAKDYEGLAKMLRARGSGRNVPFAGGISVADKEARATDEDRPSDAFARGQFDGPDSTDMPGRWRDPLLGG